MPTASRMSVVGKSPLTERIKESNVGGMAGMILAQLDVGALVIRGMSQVRHPKLLLLGKRSAELDEYALFARLIGALTGAAPSLEEVRRIGQEALSKERGFNQAGGIGPGQDRLPKFMRSEVLPPNNSAFDVEEDDLDRVFGDFPS